MRKALGQFDSKTPSEKNYLDYEIFIIDFRRMCIGLDGDYCINGSFLKALLTLVRNY